MFIYTTSNILTGSGEGHTVYFYKRACPLGSSRTGCKKINLPQISKELPAIEIYTDKAFFDAIKLAVGPVQALLAHATEAVREHLASERPKRDHKPNVRYAI